MIELLLVAEQFIDEGALDRAEHLYAQVAEADPRNAIAVAGLARVALARGDRERAVAEAHRALVIDPEEVAAQRLIAHLAFAAAGVPIDATVSDEDPGPVEPPAGPVDPATGGLSTAAVGPELSTGFAPRIAAEAPELSMGSVDPAAIHDVPRGSSEAEAVPPARSGAAAGPSVDDRNEAAAGPSVDDRNEPSPDDEIARFRAEAAAAPLRVQADGVAEARAHAAAAEARAQAWAQAQADAEEARAQAIANAHVAAAEARAHATAVAQAAAASRLATPGSAPEPRPEPPDASPRRRSLLDRLLGLFGIRR